MSRRDDEIKQDVAEQLKWDSRLHTSNINVTVLDRVVVLEGTVPTLWAKIAATEDCKLIGGVLRVDNLLNVSSDASQKPNDRETQESVVQTLKLNPNIDAGRITVSCSGGVVSLTGSVDSMWKRQLVEDAASHVVGVVSVDDQLTTVPSQSVDDEEIAAHINAALHRNMMVEAATISVHVSGGIAELSGTVSSHAALRAAKDIAIHTSGVIDIDDQLAISGHYVES